MDKSQYILPKDWTPEQVQAKLQNLIDHVERLKDDWWDDDLKGLINVHGIFSPELAIAYVLRGVVINLTREIHFLLQSRPG